MHYDQSTLEDREYTAIQIATELAHRNGQLLAEAQAATFRAIDLLRELEHLRERAGDLVDENRALRSEVARLSQPTVYPEATEGLKIGRTMRTEPDAATIEAIGPGF
jgi:regulator of replication initiation timing